MFLPVKFPYCFFVAFPTGSAERPGELRRILGTPTPRQRPPQGAAEAQRPWRVDESSRVGGARGGESVMGEDGAFFERKL